jgi:glycosyltransferase involved in cell wall biosynthesis
MIPMSNIPKGRFLAQSLRLLARSLIGVPRDMRRFRRERETTGRQTKDRPRALFFYSQVVWQEVWQRPQELALGLADSLPVVFVSPLQVHRLYDSVPGWQRDILIDRGHGLRVVQPLILPGEYKSRLVFALNRRLILADACNALPADADLVFLSNSPFSADLLDRLDWAMCAYDLIDDFPGFSWAPPFGRRLEDRWLAKADVVTSGTHALQQRHASKRPDIAFIPSGVRFDLFHDPPGDVPDDLRSLPRPILGYTGTVSDRLDRRLIEQLCREFPEGSIVLIGPVHGSFDRPAAAQNLHLLGPRPHERLPAYVANFDLALMPFLLNEATRAINPVKTLEYLAAGRVVISTPVPDVVRFFSNEVIVAQDCDAFVRLAREWLERDATSLRERGVARAREASWDEMVRQFVRRLRLE